VRATPNPSPNCQDSVLHQTDIEELVHTELNRMDAALMAAVRPPLVTPHLEQRVGLRG